MEPVVYGIVLPGLVRVPGGEKEGDGDGEKESEGREISRALSLKHRGVK